MIRPPATAGEEWVVKVYEHAAAVVPWVPAWCGWDAGPGGLECGEGVEVAVADGGVVALWVVRGGGVG